MNGDESCEDLQRQISNVRADLEVEQWRRRKCAGENKDLQAHCDRLRGALQQMVDEAAHLAGFSANTERRVIDALNETPTQSLLAVRAEAWRDGFVEGANWYERIGAKYLTAEAYIHERDYTADKHAEKIKEDGL